MQIPAPPSLQCRCAGQGVFTRAVNGPSRSSAVPRRRPLPCQQGEENGRTPSQGLCLLRRFVDSSSPDRSADTSHLAQRMYLVCDSVFAFDPLRQLSLFVMQMPSGAQRRPLHLAAARGCGRINLNSTGNWSSPSQSLTDDLAYKPRPSPSPPYRSLVTRCAQREVRCVGWQHDNEASR